MLSDNINKKFFGKDIPFEETITRNHGTVEVRQRGTLSLLAAWLRERFPNQDSEVIDGIVNPLKEVRKLRQEPAHKISDNEYDKAYYQAQDRLMERVYRSISYLRQLLNQNPTAHGYEGNEGLGHRNIKY